MEKGLTFAAAAVLVALAYAVADRNRSGRLGRLARIFLVLLNAGLNGLLAAWLAGPAAALIALVVLPAGLPAFSRNRMYQGLLGWMNWLLPMSWPVTGAGLVLAWIDLVGYAAWGRGVTRIHSITFDARTCTISIEGGIIIPFRSRGFNMGNFTFLRPGHRAVIRHETGHALNLAAFGAIFHCIGALDENVPPLRRHADAYAEHLAESHRWPDRVAPPLRMWGRAGTQ